MLFLMKEKKLRDSMALQYEEFNVACHFLDISDPKSVDEFYEKEKNAIGLVTDIDHPAFSIYVWIDLLDSIANRLPVIVVSDTPRNIGIGEVARGNRILWMPNPNPLEVLSFCDVSGPVGLSQKDLYPGFIPLYNEMLSLHMLRKNGSLSILTIHSTDFKKIATEYGNEVYHTFQKCLKEILLELWGTSGSFRVRDILCRSIHHPNTYYVLLEQSRSDVGIPGPSTLEKLSDRVVLKLQSLFWHEIQKPPQYRRIPSYLKNIPDFHIGYGTAIYNPCVDPAQIISSLLEASFELAALQKFRITNRKKELMQVLIQTDHLLVPYYQAVFDLKSIKIEDLEKAIKTETIKPLKPYIYSFESLIRINSKKVSKIFEDLSPVFLEAKYLRPDVLFAMAYKSHLALELDQTCLRCAAFDFAPLPGKLMVNILPRNFYHIEALKPLIPNDIDVIFEVSESEAINNFDLLLESRERLGASSQKFGIAIDDFGQGFSGLDRIIKIRPDVIKLDRSLISYIDQEEAKLAFVTALVEAAMKTQSVILAEGVERMEELMVLKKIGVDLFQGFLLHKPQSRQEIQQDLESQDEVIDFESDSYHSVA